MKGFLAGILALALLDAAVSSTGAANRVGAIPTFLAKGVQDFLSVGKPGLSTPSAASTTKPATTAPPASSTPNPIHAAAPGIQNRTNPHITPGQALGSGNRGR